ncbi:VOC family protein [uncultured Oceanisphaera sp.]|uniref:2-oxoadipate dioxygenase/decarboxylase HglS n=1 Tax=uncultured Oceanisphaera sp. TaxID=353858 RepID=UPI00262DE4BF|nr:VOC family protein [uncultured Oceanisphaera sp.]
MAHDSFLPADDIRTLFSESMSRMYQQEVPQYGTLMQLVAQINERVLAAEPALQHQLRETGELDRLSLERHGAIRVGRAAELNMLRRIFAIMGMHPVSYYDLSEAGVPVHSTAFRPTDDASLRRNPFRIFTSLLRLELIEDDALRARAAEILDGRDIFTAKARVLVAQAEAQGGLTEEQARHFVAEVLETFRWHQHATVDLASYQALQDAHRLIADVVCFRGPHINHLTPRTLDIDTVQQQMPAVGINPKAVIEGPPRRRCPILLRQTSFTALEEPVRFAGEQAGTHTARFGEIEQRGMALTPKGRALYDELLNRSRQTPAEADNEAHQRQLAEVFADFPDDEDSLRTLKLGYFRYGLTEAGRRQAERGESASGDIDTLIEAGLIKATPIIYEDFLPVSAAGIFQSNLGGVQHQAYVQNANQAAFEQALGCPVQDEFALYARLQDDSIRQVRQALGA